MPISPCTTKGQAIRVASNGFCFSQDEACKTSVAALTSARDTMLTTEEDKPGFAFKQQGAAVLFVRDIFQITGITVASGPCLTFSGTAAE